MIEKTFPYSNNIHNSSISNKLFDVTTRETLSSTNVVIDFFY